MDDKAPNRSGWFRVVTGCSYHRSTAEAEDQDRGGQQRARQNVAPYPA